MDFNNICGEVLSKEAAEYYRDLCLSLNTNIIFALDCNKKCSFTTQKSSAWNIRTSRRPDPQDKEILRQKAEISSCHVAFYEEWKEIKYKSKTPWPVSPYKGSLWNIFTRAMDQDKPSYESRNWFSHEYGRSHTTLEKEKEQFESLLQAYDELLPTLQELIAKLDSSLEDDTAWTDFLQAKERRYKTDLLDYTKDSEAVQLELAKNLELFQARTRQQDIDYEAYLARIEAEKNDPWGADKSWVQTEEVDNGWSQGAESLPASKSWQSCESDREVGYPSDLESEPEEEAEDLEGLPATLTPKDWAYDSGYESSSSVTKEEIKDEEQYRGDIPATSPPQDWAYRSGSESGNPISPHCKTCTCESS